jgi:hypothetical protein
MSNALTEIKQIRSAVSRVGYPEKLGKVRSTQYLFRAERLNWRFKKPQQLLLKYPMGRLVVVLAKQCLH